MLSKSYKILENIEEEGNIIILPSFIIPELIIKDHPGILKDTYWILEEGDLMKGTCLYLSTSANPDGDRYELIINGEKVVLWI